MTSEFLASARGLRGLIESEAAKPENADTMSPVVVEALRERGLFWLLVPEELGGSDVRAPRFMEVIEEIASSDASTGWSLMANSVATMVAATYSSDAHVARMFGGERMPVMTSTFAPSGKVTFSDGVYRGGGTHSFGSGIAHADWVSGANMVVQDGAPVMQADGTPKMVGAFLRKDQIKVAGNWDVVGLKATGSFDYLVPEQDIPADWTFNQYWTEPQRPGRGGQMGIIPVNGAGHSAVMLGMARRALHEAARIASQKKRLRSQDSIATTPVFQLEFVKHEALFQAARALVFDVFEAADRLVDDGQALSDHDVQRIRQVTTWLHGVCRDVVSWAYGSVSSSLRNPSVLGKYLIDASVAAQHFLVDPMSLIAAAPLIVEDWAQDRLCDPAAKTSVRG